MRVAIVSLVALAACRPTRWIVVDVRSADGAPVVGATVSAACQPRGSAAELSGVDGTVVLPIVHDEPDRCTVTATAAGFATVQDETTTMCSDRARCAPVELRLEAE